MIVPNKIQRGTNLEKSTKDLIISEIQTQMEHTNYNIVKQMKSKKT